MINKTGVYIILVSIFITSLFICFETTFGQSVPSTAVPFLLINPSPDANGQGCTSISRVSDDPYAINLNPAHLGLSSAQTNAMFSFYPTKTLWLPGLGLDDITFNAIVFSGGINLEKYTTLPVSIGIAYSRVDLNLGPFNRTSSSPDIVGTFTGEEHHDALSAGFGLDLGVRLAIGITFRRIESNLADFGAGQEQGSGSASAWSHDFGLLINVPLIDLVAKKSELITGIAPLFDLSVGSALTNVGGKMTYIDKAQADPLPRNISVGTTIELGFKFTRTDQKLLSCTWSRQSDNLLVGRDNLNSFYRGGFGDIDIFKNIVQGKRTETIDLSQGWQIGIAEIVFIRGGSYVGSGNRSFTTEGLGLRLSGFLKLLQGLEVKMSNELSFITEHFDIRYDQSDYKAPERNYPLDNTGFSSLTIVVKL
jgi:hypothetical protein